MPSPTCPIREELKLYAVGKLDDERSDEIDAHLDDCTDCQALLGTIGAADDTLLDSLKQPVEEDPYIREVECQEALALVQAIGREPSFIGESAAGAANVDSTDLGQIRDYKLLAKLGEGGMGTVYKALHTHLNKIVALKLLPKEQTADENAIARFRREMQAVGALEHPNIVRATDAGEHEGVHFLVMEYVKGQDLSRLSKQQGPLPIAEACEMVRRAAVGLQHAYQHGLIHRDIKPSNLMLSNSGEVKVLDLGLALLQEQHVDSQRDLTSTGQMMGTIDYMAPEQGDDSHEVDIRADIYSLGATLYRLLCGQAPFADGKYNKPVKKLRALAIEPVPPIDQRRPEVPQELAAIVHRMLEKERDNRPATPGEVAALLEPFAASSDLRSLVVPVEVEPDEMPRDPSRSKSTSSHYSSALQDTTRWRSTPEEPLPSASAAEHSTTPAIGTFIQRRGIGPVVAIAVGLAAILALAAVLMLHTKNGVVEITLAEGVDAKDVQVEVLQGGEQIEIADAKQGWKIQLANGDYRLSLGKGADRFELSQDTVVVRRGDKVRVKVTQKPLPEGAAPVAVAEAPVRDKEKAGGTARTSPPEARPNPFDRAAPRLEIAQHDPISRSAFVSHPAKIEGLKSWTLDTWRNRGTAGVSYSPDGKWLATSSQGTTRIFNAATGEFMRAFIGRPRWQHSLDNSWLQWSQDSKRIAMWGDGGAIHFWEVATGQLVKSLVHEGGDDHSYRSLAWSRDSSLLASAVAGNVVRIWNVETGKNVGVPSVALHGTWAPRIAWLPDDLLAISDTSVVHIWSLDKEKVIREIRQPGVGSMWTSEHYLLGRDAGPKKGNLWDTKSGEIVRQDIAYPRGLSPDGRTILKVGGDNQFQFMDVETGEIRGKTAGKAYSCTWSPDGRRIACGRDSSGGIEVYDARTGDLLQHIDGHNAILRACAWSPDGKTFAIGEETPNVAKVRLLDAKSGRQQKLINAPGDMLTWSPDSQKLIAGIGWWTRRVVMIDATLGKVQQVLSEEDAGGNRTWAPDSRRCAFCRNGTIRIWDAVESKTVLTLEATYPQHEVRKGILAWSPNGRHIANIGREGDVLLWDVDNGKLQRKAKHEQTNPSIAFSPDGSVFATLERSSQGTRDAILWDASTLKRLITLTGHQGVVYDIYWPEDGKTVVTLGSDAIRVWDRRTGNLRRTIPGTAGQLFSPDAMLTASWDSGHVNIRDSRTGDTIAKFLPLDDGKYLTLSGNGHYRGSPDIESELIYIALTDDDRQISLTPAEFEKQYGWKNDPEQVSLIAEQHAEPAARTNPPSPAPPRAEPLALDLKPEPRDFEPGQPIGGLISKPAEIDGLKSWTIETRRNRYRTFVRYSPDGRWLAAQCLDQVRLYDTQTLQLERLIIGAGITWSGDSRYLAGWGPKNTVRLYEAANGRLVKTFQGHRWDKENIWPKSMAWSPDNKYLASLVSDGYGKGLIIWDVVTGKLEHQLKVRITRSSPGNVSWSPDGHLLVVSTAYAVKRWDREKERFLEDIPPNNADGIGWLAGGSELALHRYMSSETRVYDPVTGKFLYQIDEHVRAASPAGRKFAAGKGGGIHVIDLTRRHVLSRIALAPRTEGDGRNIEESVDWSPDGKSLAVGTNRGEVQIFDAASGLLTRRAAGHGSFVTDAEWAPDSKTLAIGNSDDLRLFDVQAAEQQHFLNGYGNSIAWSPQGSMLIAGHSRLRLFDRIEGKSLRDFTGGHPSWHPNGKLVAVARDKETWIIDASSGDVMRRLKYDGSFNQLGKSGWSSDGKRLVTSTSIHELHLWDTSTGELLQSRQAFASSRPICWSPTSDLVAVIAMDGRSIQILDGDTLKVVHTLVGHADSVKALCWTEDGKTLISGGSDGAVRHWNAASGSLQGTTIGPVADSFSPDGRYSVFSGREGYGDRVQIYENRTGELLASIFPLSGKAWVCVSPDGHWRGSEGIQDDLLYIALTEDGEQLTLTPDEFQRTYGWKNDPEQVKLTVD